MNLTTLIRSRDIVVLSSWKFYSMCSMGSSIGVYVNKEVASNGTKLKSVLLSSSLKFLTKLKESLISYSELCVRGFKMLDIKRDKSYVGNPTVKTIGRSRNFS